MLYQVKISQTEKDDDGMILLMLSTQSNPLRYKVEWRLPGTSRRRE